jgi:hypothetical protein
MSGLARALHCYGRAPTPLKSSLTRAGPLVRRASGGVSASAPERIPANSSRSASIEDRRGSQPSSVRALELSMSGTESPMSTHPGSLG